MPSAEVPLITPATIIGFFVMFAEVRNLSGEVSERPDFGLAASMHARRCQPDLLAELPEFSGKFFNSCERKELSPWCAEASPICF